MIIDENRLKVQEYAISLWEKKDYIGTFEWATGVGKTFAGVLAMKRFPGIRKMIIVPSRPLKSQWLKEITKHQIINAKVIVVNTAIKHFYETDLLVLDEIHRFNANTFSQIFDKIKYNKVLGLTATFERTDKKHYFMEKHCPIIHKIPIKEALRLGFISDMIVYNYGIKLSDEAKKIYEYYDKEFNKYFQFFNYEFDLAMSCLKTPEARKVYSIRSGYDEKTIRVMAINFNRTMAKRKELIYYNRDKLSAVLNLVNIYKSNKIIVFTERVNIMNTLHKLIKNSYIYDTKFSKDKKDSIINNFTNSENGVLIAVKALDEGIDIPDADIGIIHSNSSSKRQMVQRSGRIIRKNEDKIALIINVYLEDTQDKKWLLNRIEGVPNMYWTNDINQITYEPSEECLKEENRISDFTQRIKLF